MSKRIKRDPCWKCDQEYNHNDVRCGYCYEGMEKEYWLMGNVPGYIDQIEKDNIIFKTKILDKQYLKNERVNNSLIRRLGGK